MSSKAREFVPVPIAVMTVSDSRTEADDKSGKLLVERLTGVGHRIVEKVFVLSCHAGSLILRFRWY